MQVVTHPQEQLDALVPDVGEGVQVCLNAVVGLLAVGAASVHSHVPMPVPTAEWK